MSEKSYQLQTLSRALDAELPRFSSKLRSVKHYDGMPLTADIVVEAIVSKEREG